MVHEEAINRSDGLWWRSSSEEGKQKIQNAFVRLRAPGKEMEPLKRQGVSKEAVGVRKMCSVVLSWLMG